MGRCQISQKKALRNTWRSHYLIKLEKLADILRDKLHFSLTVDDKQEAIQSLQYKHDDTL